MLALFFLLFGLIIGSFLNVLILRLPKEENSSLMTRSYCPKCGKLVAWYDNIPLLSFIILKAKCRYCKAKISWQYPLIELLTGLISLALLPKNLSPEALLQYFFLFSIFCVFLVHAIIDLRHQILPDGLTLYLALLFLSYSLIHQNWKFWLIGGAVGFLLPLLATWLFYLLRGQIGLGGGDIKLWGALGLYLGPFGIIQNIFVSCFLGSIIGGSLLLTKRISRETPIPFGPFILLASTIQIVLPNFWNWLFN